VRWPHESASSSSRRRQPSGAQGDPEPPHVSEADKPLRRVVALAYRSARQAGKSHRDAYDEAMAVYAATRPGEAHLAAASRVAEMIASAINIDPAWFWKNVPPAPDLRHPISD
jgi:hypothetical protein